MLLCLAAAKAGLPFGMGDTKSLLDRVSTVRAAEYFLAPAGWPWWQLFLIGAAVLTLLFPLFAEPALARLDSDHPWREQMVLAVTVAVSFVRTTVGLLAMAYLFWSALHLVFSGLARWT